MNIRASLLLVGLLALGGCGTYWCRLETENEPIELDIDTDLHAIALLGVWEDSRSHDYLAVGADGIVVVWGRDHADARDELFVEVSDLGDAELRDAWVNEMEEYGITSMWVVGDAGTIAISDDLGATWQTVELPLGGASLHAITGFSGRPVIVGDELVLVQLADGTWIEPPQPPDGWGQLRGVATVREQIYAVGLAGVAWSTSDPSGEWFAEPVGVDVDLFDVGSFGDVYVPVYADVAIVGAQGTVLISRSNGWHRPSTGVSVDLIDYDNNFAVGTDGGVYELASDGPLMLSKTIAGARALSTGSLLGGLATVGDDGSATAPPGFDCHDEPRRRP
jgi:hypothetical protein